MRPIQETEWQLLGRQDAPANLQAAELWQVLLRGESENLIAALSNPAILLLAAAVSDQPGIRAAYDLWQKARFDNPRKCDDLAGRALMRVCLRKRYEPQHYISELFATITGYYLSQTFPGLVGSPGRVATVSGSIALQRDIKASVQILAERISPPVTTADAWRWHVGVVARQLAGG
jgi:hypothetical protein